MTLIGVYRKPPYNSIRYSFTTIDHADIQTHFVAIETCPITTINHPLNTKCCGLSFPIVS